MQLAHLQHHTPHLVMALEALAHHAERDALAPPLLDELSGITLLVAKRFTNEHTADGMAEALQLTMGCISLGISQAKLPEDAATYLTFLQQHGAEYVFQMGFRHIKSLAALPYTAFVSDFDNDPYIRQRDIKVLFGEICRADPVASWQGEEIYDREWRDRQNNQRIVACAQWLRQKHHAGAIRDTDLDAHAVIAIAVIFGISSGGRIVARVGQREIEQLIRSAREDAPDIDANWKKLLKKVPSEHQDILRQRMEEYRGTIIKKILSRTALKKVIVELQDFYACGELEVEYD